MTQTPYHLYRATDANYNSEESEDLQAIKDWRDANAPGTPIYDIVIASRLYYDVAHGIVTRSFLVEQEAVAYRDANAPGATITNHTEDYEVEPFDIVPE